MKWSELVPWRQSKSAAPAKREGDPFFAMQNEMNRVFENFFKSTPSTGIWGSDGEYAFSPSIDVNDSEKELTVRAELPGLKEEDLDISIDDEYLTLKGEKKFEEERKENGATYVESSYGSFQRVIPLGVDIDLDAVDASMKNGVLTIALPKKDSPNQKKRTISVRSA